MPSSNRLKRLKLAIAMTDTVSMSTQRVSQRFFRSRPEDALPLTIEHQRIYIVPSKRGLAYLLALVVCLIASINYQLNLGYALSFLLAGMFSASLLHTYKNLAGITLESMHASSVSLGEPAKFIVRLGNKTAVDRIGIDVKYGNKCRRTDLLTDSITTVELPVAAQERGYLSLGRLTFTSQFPIGLWTTWSYCHAPAWVIVHPQPEQNPPPLPQGFTEGCADAAQLSNEGDVAGLRDYVPGDPLTRVAWKRAARTGGASGLHVRELEQNMAGGDIDLSLSITNAHGLEAQLSRLSAWVNEATRTGASFSLTLNNTAIKTNTGDAHRLQCLDALGVYKKDKPGVNS